MSMIFQSYALWPHMTIAENVAYGLKLRRLDRAERERRVAAILDVTRLGRTRVALSARIVRRPAAARGARAGARRRAGNAAARRAAFQPRRQSARGDALRDPPPARRLQVHDDLCHARPGRGDDDRRYDRRDESAAGSSRSARPRTSISGRARNSSPALSAAPTSSAAGISETAWSIAARVVLRCGAGEPAAAAETAVSVRLHDITLTAGRRAPRPSDSAERSRRARSCGNPISGRIATISSALPTARRCASPRRSQVNVPVGGTVRLHFPPEHCRALAR